MEDVRYFVMEPLSPNDPLHTLLGKAKAVEPRPNFTQNVMREIRQTPQTVGLWERVQVWLQGLTGPRLALAGVAAAVVLSAVVVALQKPASQDAVVAQKVRQPVVRQAMVAPALHEISASMILAATAEPAPVVKVESVPVTEVDDMDPMELLLVQDDTSALTDSELALLVY